MIVARRALRIVLLSGAALGCRTVGQDPLDFDRAPLFGMIYDADNQPVSAAQVIVDGKAGPQSDLNRRFVLPALKRGAHGIRVEKEGYEPISADLQFLNRSQVLYLKMSSLEQILEAVEEAIEAAEWSKAKETLRRAEKLNPRNLVYRYLTAILAFKTGGLETSARILKDLLKDGYREPFVFLFLADLYEYHLGDTEEAKRYLQEYLKGKGDPEAENRIKMLEEAERIDE